MNIHENKHNSNRSKSTCGYCRETGHNQYQCPHVKGDWENFLSRLEIPKDKDGNLIRRGYNYAMYHVTNEFDPLTHDIANNALASWFRNCQAKPILFQKERGFNLNQKRKVVVQTAHVVSVDNRVTQDVTVPRWISSSKIATKPMKTGEWPHTKSLFLMVVCLLGLVFK